MNKGWYWAALPLVLIALLLLFGPGAGSGFRGWAFLIVMALLAIEFAIIGQLINHRLIGAFIDNRNRLSLSKLQAGAWTVLVLSALATAAAFNAFAPGVNYGTVAKVFVNIPGELLLAMGISATSLVASPALLSLKAEEEASPDAQATAQATAAAKGAPAVVPNGKLANKPSPTDASWADLFTGEEVGNVGTPDLGRIQQVLITLILLAVYGGYVFQSFVTGPSPFLNLPTLDKSFVWLLGLSHATYLAYKAAPHTSNP